MALVNNPPNYVELRRYDGTTDTTSSGLSNIRMEQNHADHHVRLFFTARAGVTAGAVINVTLVGTPNASCSSASTPAPVTVAWALTIATPAAWQNQGENDATSDGPFSPLRLAASNDRTATGLAFHQSSSACRQIDVALVNNPPSYVELRRYDGTTDTTSSGLSNIRMEQNHASDHHVRLFFKSSAGVTAGSVVNVTLVGDAELELHQSGDAGAGDGGLGADDRDAGDVD